MLSTICIWRSNYLAQKGYAFMEENYKHPAELEGCKIRIITHAYICTYALGRLAYKAEVQYAKETYGFPMYALMRK